MKELDPAVLWAVFYEMMGFWLWFFVALAILSLWALYRIIKAEKRLDMRRFVYAEAFGILLGGPAALVVMALVSSSGFTDAAAPIDWFLIGIVYAIGWAAGTIILYDLMGWTTLKQSLQQSAS